MESWDVASEDLELICRLKPVKVVSEVQGKAAAFLSTLQGCAQCHHFSGWGGFQEPQQTPTQEDYLLLALPSSPTARRLLSWDVWWGFAY